MASYQPRPRFQVAIAMCSLKTFPKPGLARMRSRSAAGARFVAGVTLNVRPTVALMVVSSVTQTNEAEPGSSASREEGRGVLGVERLRFLVARCGGRRVGRWRVELHHGPIHWVPATRGCR